MGDYNEEDDGIEETEVKKYKREERRNLRRNVGEGCTKWAPQPKWAPARLPLLTMVRVIFHYWC